MQMYLPYCIDGDAVRDTNPYHLTITVAKSTIESRGDRVPVDGEQYRRNCAFTKTS